MPVPTSISELSQTAGSNPPSGSDSPTVTDDHFRASYSFIAWLRDVKASITDVVLLTGNQTIAGVKTFSSAIVANLTGNVTGNVSGTAANVTGIVARANGGLGASYASDAAIFAGIKQAASDTATGVVELATTAKVQAGIDPACAVTPAAMQNGKIVQGTAVLVSGSTVDFTGIPSWAKRVNIMFWGVSGAGSTTWILQLGTSSGFETTGYLSSTTSASTFRGTPRRNRRAS